MKTVRFFLLFGALVFSCSNSQVGVNGFKWSSVHYFFDSGPLPPKYHYDFMISINNDGHGNFVYNYGYDKGTPSATYELSVPKDSIALLDAVILESRILDNDIKPVPDNERPIGGSIKKIRVILPDTNRFLDRPPKVIESPEFPEKKYRTGLNKLYEIVERQVPVKIWDELKMKREE